MFSLPIILGIACIREDFGIWRYGLPIALSGLFTSIIHIIIYWNILPIMMMPCSEYAACSGKRMAIGRIPIPLLSMLSFSMIIGLLLLAKNRKKQ
jgi:disulfide bond formation protein DsbB